MPSIPSPSLQRFLSQRPDSDQLVNPSAHVSAGAEKVGADDLKGLIDLLPLVAAKAAKLVGADRLKRRLDLLAQFFLETEPQGSTAERREVAFGLFYFLKGFDLIPDTVPEIGLLDDALLAETIYQRNQLALRSHWAARGRAWPGEA